MELTEIRAIVDAQAEDDGLWFRARTAPEAYLQQELRRLHEAIEAAIPRPNGPTPERAAPGSEDGGK